MTSHIAFQGVCESAQGFANFVLFCLFTEKFQTNVRRALYKRWPHCYRGMCKQEPPEVSENRPVYSGEYSEMHESSSLLREYSEMYESSSLLREYSEIYESSSFVRTSEPGLN